MFPWDGFQVSRQHNILQNWNAITFSHGIMIELSIAVLFLFQLLALLCSWTSQLTWTWETQYEIPYFLLHYDRFIVCQKPPFGYVTKDMWLMNLVWLSSFFSGSLLFFGSSLPFLYWTLDLHSAWTASQTTAVSLNGLSTRYSNKIHLQNYCGSHGNIKCCLSHLVQCVSSFLLHQVSISNIN